MSVHPSDIRVACFNVSHLAVCRTTFESFEKAFAKMFFRFSHSVSLLNSLIVGRVALMYRPRFFSTSTWPLVAYSDSSKLMFIQDLTLLIQ